MLSLLQNNITPARRKDPTKTATLRSKFSADASARLHRLRTNIKNKVVNEDFFGLAGQNGFKPKGNVFSILAKFEYQYTDQKIKDFMDWLKDQHSKGLLELTIDPLATGTLQGQPWSNYYIRSAYQSGLAQARSDAIARGILVDPFPPVSGGSGTTISGGFFQPFHADRAALVYTRVFNDLVGVTQFIDASISRVMAQGMSEGVGPYEMARRMNDVIEHTTGKPLPPAHPKGPRGITRARLIARTETIRAYNVAAINEYERMEADIGEKVYAQWIATLDDRTRDEHRLRNNKVYLRETALGMLGEPNCRCSVIPWVKKLNGKGKKYRLSKGELVPYESKKVTKKKTRKITDKWQDQTNLNDIRSEYEKRFGFLPSTEGFSLEESVNSLNEIGDRLDKLSRQNDLFKESLKKVKSIDIHNTKNISSLYEQTAGIQGRVTGVFDPENKAVNIAWRRSNRTNQLSFQDWSVDDSLYGTIRHEIGHAQYLSMENTRGHRLWEAFYNDHVHKMDGEFFGANVSGYARTNSSEGFAEFFSAFTHKDYSKIKELVKNDTDIELVESVFRKAVGIDDITDSYLKMVEEYARY